MLSVVNGMNQEVTMSRISRSTTCVKLFGEHHPVNNKGTVRSHGNLKRLTGVFRPGKTANDKANGAWKAKRPMSRKKSSGRVVEVTETSF